MFLHESYREEIRGWVPRERIVLSHNDTQENNLLASLADSSQLTLIDYEYGNWNPMYYDLGVYLNEMMCDNAHPKAPGIKIYEENWPSDAEIETITRLYWELNERHQGNTSASWSMGHPECQEAVLMTKKCMLLNNFYWITWALMVMRKEEEADPEAYYWDFLSGKCKLHLRTIKQFNLGTIP